MSTLLQQAVQQSVGRKVNELPKSRTCCRTKAFTRRPRAWRLPHSEFDRIEEFVAHGANVNCLALGHKSGRVLVTGGDDKKVNLWAVGKPNCILSLSGHSTAVECVQFGGSEDFVCAGSLSGALKIWDLEATKIVRTLTGHKSNIRSIAFHPYGDFICTGSLDTNIKLWDIKRKGCIFTYKGHNLSVNSLKFSPDGQWIASAGEDCVVKLWDLRAGKMLTEFNSHTGPVSDVEFHPHEFLLASSSHDKTINFWDLEKLSLVSTTDADTGPIRTIAFHPEGSCIYAGATDVLKVYGWEPSRSFDTVAMGWGKVQDVAITQNQLIGAAFHGAYVSLYVIDLKRVQPFGGSQSDDHAAFKHNSTIRKSFILNQKSGKENCDSIKTEDASDTGGDEGQEDISPELANLNYKDAFLTQRELQRTPPPLLPHSPANNNESRNPSSMMPEVVRPEPQRPALVAPPLSRLPPSEAFQKPALPSRPQRFDTNSNFASNAVHSPPTNLPNLMTERRGSSNDVSSGSAQSDAALWSQPYRARAVSESRRNVQGSGNLSDMEPPNRHIRHSPSDPYLVSQQQLMDPTSSPPMNPSVHLPRFEHTSTPKKSSPKVVSFVGPPKDTPVSYLGTPKETPDYSSYIPDKLTNNFMGYPFERKRPELDHLLAQHNAFDQKFSDALSLGGLGSTKSVTGIMGNEMSEQEVLSSVMRGHTTMRAMLQRRARGLNDVRKLWLTKDLRTAVEHTLNAGDQSILIDFLGVLNLRPSIWNLDILTLLLPPVSLLLQSEHEAYATCGCETLKLMLKNFSPMIKSNMQGPIHSVGIDISREERYKKCVECYNHMMSIRMFVMRKQALPGKLGHNFRELVILMQDFD